MAVRLNDKFLKTFITDAEIEAMNVKIKDAHEKLVSRSGLGNQFLGWLDLPVNYDKAEIDRIISCAERIKNNSDILIVIGIGGSYLGARAVVEFLYSPLYNNKTKNTPDIYFIGNSISPDALSDIIALCENKDISINVVSKSGTTTEPAIAFRLFRKMLEEKYSPEEAKSRIYVTTDKNPAKSKLKELSILKGYETFTVPDDIGGRYSVLTPVGLLPIAVSGADINKLMQGATNARSKFFNENYDNDCYKYAALRNILYNKGKSVEILASYEPSMQLMHEWWKQLYGESEGKDKKGIYPSSVIFSTDLHSLGQYIQDGVRFLFETVVDIKDSVNNVIIPPDDDKIDGMDYINNFSLDYVNKKAFLATVLAHVDGGVPNIIIEIDKRNEENLGELIYFFELACAVSGYVLGVNPFDQPGVEDYKKNMFALLGNENYADRKQQLEKRLEN